jgi:glutamate N-acetyltransferase/amino-acid N-acetyltransferase
LKLPLGYRYASTYAGIRKVEKDDLALIVSGSPASAAAVFTTNRVQAGPVRVGKANLAASRGRVSAVLINAGNANCANRTEDRVALESCRLVSEALGVPQAQVIPSSTGVIGVELDVNLIAAALPRLVERLSPDRFEDAAHAIMTTDLTQKVAFSDAFGIRVAGMTKGSGMIQPNMATTLCFVMTDAALSPTVLKGMLKQATARSFNRLSVDGETSTNDTALLLANGAFGKKPGERQAKALQSALNEVMESLAEQIARDGEGAQKLIVIDVLGAATDAAAERIARSIANSLLVKTAVHGSDANWGRILSAAGQSGAVFEPVKVDIDLQGVPVCRSGFGVDFDEPTLKAKLDLKECHIRFRIRGSGKAKTRFWSCDLTKGYIDINASYRT